jgi:methionyl aminopeptidase
MDTARQVTNIHGYLKSPRELDSIRESSRRLKVLMQDLIDYVEPGVTAKEIDRYAAKRMKELELRSGAYRYGDPRNPFPGYICISVNDVIVHGVPSQRRIEKGDIVSLDVACSHKGWFSDTATTLAVGQVDDEAETLMQVCREALYRGIEQARPGNHLFDIGHAIQEYAEGHELNVVRVFTGHGIGREMHEAPSVPHYGEAGKGLLLREGMVICIEPQLTIGSPNVRFLRDGWTAVTEDGSRAAHFEHAVAITANGPEILTELPSQMEPAG